MLLFMNGKMNNKETPKNSPHPPPPTSIHILVLIPLNPPVASDVPHLREAIRLLIVGNEKAQKQKSTSTKDGTKIRVLIGQ